MQALELPCDKNRADTLLIAMLVLCVMLSSIAKLCVWGSMWLAGWMVGRLSCGVYGLISRHGQQTKHLVDPDANTSTPVLPSELQNSCLANLATFLFSGGVITVVFYFYHMFFSLWLIEGSDAVSTAFFMFCVLGCVASWTDEDDKPSSRSLFPAALVPSCFRSYNYRRQPCVHADDEEAQHLLA